MPATVKTRELFPKASVTRDGVEAERRLRIKAGAIRSIVREEGSNWVLETEWNVLGEDDSD